MLITKRCIIIPAFNEEKQIASVIEGIRKYSDADIVVIDDGSEDMTAEIARKAGALRDPASLQHGLRRGVADRV